MSYPYFKRILFSYDERTREKMLTYFSNWMRTQTVKNLIPTVKPATKSITKSRPQIPKMIRGEVWKEYNGLLVYGSCYCCKRTLDVFDTWNAGHVVPYSHGGPNTVTNLRPICQSCNQSMGTENLYDFKKAFYPDK
jgi:5-methylcytosine-specific restriction endonuclease McrA